MSLEIVFWDVQHGNATYIKTPNGRHFVIDLGTGSYKDRNLSFSPLLHIKNRYGVERINFLIITHPHKDHISDILNIDKLYLNSFHRPWGLKKEDVMKGVRDEDKPYYEKYFELDKIYSAPASEENRLDKPDNWGGVIFESFYPPIDSTNINNCSHVTVINYAQSKIIIPGDNEPSSWQALLKNPSFVRAISNADIFLAPHHGRESGWCKDLFEYFKPSLTIISDGRFGDTSATDRYSKISTGWTVHKRSGGSEKRYCVTTRNDGVIGVNCYYGGDKKPYLIVRID